MLGVARDNCSSTEALDGTMSCFGYISINDYMKLTAVPKPQIVIVKIGMLVRSTNSVGTNDLYDKNKSFRILSVNAKLKEDSKNNMYMRNVVTQTIALRNGFGVAKEQ